jgi:hypothetical protein
MFVRPSGRAMRLGRIDLVSKRGRGRSREHGEEFPKEFVPLPGETYPNSVLVDDCSTLLLAPKSAALN